MPHASYPANSVIACVDGSNQQPTVLEAASWAASQLVCSIGLLHAHDPARSGVTSDFSGSLSAKARESLLDKLSKADAKSARELTEHGWDQPPSVRESQCEKEADSDRSNPRLLESQSDCQMPTRPAWAR